MGEFWVRLNQIIAKYERLADRAGALERRATAIEQALAAKRYG